MNNLNLQHKLSGRYRFQSVLSASKFQHCKFTKHMTDNEITANEQNVKFFIPENLSDINYKIKILHICLNIRQISIDNQIDSISVDEKISSKVACVILNYILNSNRWFDECLMYKKWNQLYCFRSLNHRIEMCFCQQKLIQQRIKQSFSLIEMPENIDLFSSPSSYSLAHCVAEDFRMGKGIAVIFKQKFGRVDQLLKMNKKIGDVAILKDNKRFLFYLVTKKKSFEDPTFKNLIKTIKELKSKCVKLEVNHLAIPRLGCGLDKQNWEDVKLEIIRIFSDTNIQIRVYFIPYKNTFKRSNFNYRGQL